MHLICLFGILLKIKKNKNTLCYGGIKNEKNNFNRNGGTCSSTNSM